MEDDYPGLWHTWFREQVVAVGWPPAEFGLHTANAPHDWSLARRYLQQVSAGDKVIVQLKNWRVGRIGTVLSKQIEDAEWSPSVPKQGGDAGEMGRRVQVRWELTRGRLTPDFVVELPPEARSNPRIWRLTLSQVPDAAFAKMERAFQDECNWVSLVPGFASERALSEYISASPHLLEDGLVPYPSASARELVFPDRTRLDVLLLDPKQNIVIVECKQGAPTLQNIQQLRGYMRNAEKLRTGLKIGKNIRGILVHGGARKLSAEVRQESRKAPQIELVQFSVSVGFTPSL
jgi:hypothetical protein